jgi:hypothetical protein
MLFLSAWLIILTIIFRRSLETGEVPPDWRSANVSPVYKKGDRYKAENYRPISLTCIWELPIHLTFFVELFFSDVKFFQRMLTGTVYSRYLIGQLGLSGGDHHFVMV